MHTVVRRFAMSAARTPVRALSSSPRSLTLALALVFLTGCTEYPPPHPHGPPLRAEPLAPAASTQYDARIPAPGTTAPETRVGEADSLVRSAIQSDQSHFSLSEYDGFFVARNATVEELLGVAYRVPTDGRPYIATLPKCRIVGDAALPTERYDVRIRLPARGTEAIRARLQQIIAENLGIRLRRETRIGTIYVLRAPGGALTPRPVAALPPLPPNTRRVTLEGTSVAQLADSLEHELGGAVYDETDVRSMRRDPPFVVVVDVSPQDGPEERFEAALREQLGLTLTRTNGGFEAFVVERAGG